MCVCVCIYIYVCMYVYNVCVYTHTHMCCVVLSHSVMSESVTPWTVDHQAPLSMGILQARILDCIAMPSPRDFPNPGIEHRTPTLQVDSLQAELPGKSYTYTYILYVYLNDKLLHVPLTKFSWYIHSNEAEDYIIKRLDISKAL